MKQILISILGLVLAGPSWAAITFDVASSSEGTTSTSHSHTIASDANIIIVCNAIRRSSGGAAQPASAVTVGGEAATLLAGVTSSNNVMRAELWYKLTPLTGSRTISVTQDATTTFSIAGAMSFKGVAQSSTFNTSKTASSGNSANMDVSALASAVGEMAVLCGSVRSSTNSVGPDATAATSTERYEDPHSGSGTGGLVGTGYTEAGASTSIDMRVDLTSSNEWAAVAVSMRELITETLRNRGAMFFP